ncbi:MAG: Wzz/FepE/Etk N-terminal domain-containing protein, partial [Desulfobaccales bacterium]
MSNQIQNTFPVSSGSPSGPSLPSTPTPDFYYELEKGHTIREYIDILLRRKWWVIAPLFTIILLAALYNIFSTPIFRATTTLELTADNPGTNVSAEGRSMGLSWFYAQKFQETQYKILKSRSLALRVIQALNLEEYPQYATIKKNAQDKSDAEVEDMLAKVFLGGLT